MGDTIDRLRSLDGDAEELSQVLDAIPIPTFKIDSNRKITHWNRACELLTGMAADDMVGTDLHWMPFYDKPREMMADHVLKGAGEDEIAMLYDGKSRRSKVVRGGYEGEAFLPKLGVKGRWGVFTAAPIMDAHGRITGAVEAMHDVTEHRKIMENLTASEDRYRLLFESANDAIFILKDGEIVNCNPKALELFGSSREEIIGLSPLDLSPEVQADQRNSEDEIDKRREIALQDVPQLFEWRFLRKNGTQFDAEVSFTRFRIADVPYALSIVRDISDHKKLIDALERREKELAEKTDYLGKVNQALKASLDHREVETRAVEESMLITLKRLVLPYLEELGRCRIGNEARAYFDILDTNLNDILDKFSKYILSKYIDLTPAEVRIADLIRNGKNSKDIARLLGLSPSSVQWHRKNIREKLGLTNKKVNLQTYLQSLAK